MNAPTPDEAAALRSQWNADCADLQMDAYYYGFDGTGARAVDLVLSAVASAGKGSHHTEDWGECGHVEKIQEAADAAAESVRELLAERDALRRDLTTALAERDEFRDERDKDRAHARELRRDLVAAREELRGEQATSATLKTHLVSEQARLRAKLAAARPVLDAARVVASINDDPYVCAPPPRHAEAIDVLRAALAALSAPVEAGATEPAPDRPGICPTCNSAQPHLHPSADLCPDPWHEPVPMTVEGWRREVARWANLLEQISEYEIGNGALDRVAGDMIRALGGAGAPAEPTGDTERGTT